MNGVLEQANSIGKAFVAFAGPMLIQSSVLILILLLADWLLRRRVRAVLRYWIWMLVLIKLVLPTSLSLPMSLGYWFGDRLGFVELGQTSEAEQTIRIPQPRRIPVRGQATPFEPVSAGQTEPAPVPRPEHAPAEPVNPPRVSLTPLSWRGAVFLAWLAVVTAMASLLLQRAIFVRALVARARAADSSMKDILASCCERMAVKRKVGLKVSPNASSPAVCGLFHPVILVPKNLAPSLGSKRLRAVLMHELAHIKRGDLWVNLAQTFLQAVYFYNPLLWLANAIIRRVREQAVDEAVLVAMGQAAQQYPQTLLEVAKLTFKQPALSLRLIGVVESKDALAGRIKHILNRPIPKTAKLGLLGLLVVILAAVILLPMAKSQHRATWPDKDLLVKFVEAQPGPLKTISSPTKTTHVKSYDVEFAPGEELLVVAELYQAGKRMRLLGKEIFAGSTKPQKLTVSVCRAYKNESRTVFSHGAKVQLGGQVFEVPEFTVDVDRFYNDEGWGWYHGDGLRRLTNRLTKKDYAKLESLFYYRCSDGGGLSPGEARFWIPGHPITQAGSHHWIELKMMPLSRLNYLVLEPLAGQQGLDGKIIPADLTGEQARTIADKYKKMLIEEVEGQYDNSLYRKQGSIRYALEFIGTPEDIIDTTYVRRVGGQLASPQQLEFANKLFSVRNSKDVDVFVSLLSDGTKKQLNDANNSRMLHHHIKKIKEGKFIHGEYDSNFFATFLKLIDEDINNLQKHVSFAESPTHRIVYWWCHHYQVCGKSFYLIEDKGSYKLVTQTLLSGQIIPATKDQTAGPKEYGITAFKQNDEAYSKPGSWKYEWDIELTPEVSKDNVFQLLKTTKVISGRDDLHPEIAAQKIIDESEIEKYKFDILKCRCYVAPSEPSKHNRKLSGWVCGLSIASWFKSKVMLLPGKDVTNIKPNKQGNFVGSDLELLTFEASQESTKYEHKLILRKSDSPEDKSAALLRLKQMMRRQISYAKLHYLNRIVTTYANDHNSIFPHSLEQIKPYDTDEWLDWLLENVEYLGKGITHSEKSESKVALAYDKALLEKTGSTNVLFNRSSVPVEYCEPAKLEKIGITIDRKTAVQVETDKGREMRSNADARISFISADEGEDEKSYRWGITRSLPLKVIQGWYEFDEGGIRSHGGGGRKIAETRPMQLALRVSKENGFLVLHRGYAWSSTAGDQQADVGCKIEWPAGAVLRTYYLSEPAELTDKLQPVWKGELVQDSKVSKSVVYAVRVVGQNVSDELLDVSDTSEALRIGRAWAPSPDPAKKRYEGRTIEQWIAQWDSRSYDDTRAATEALTRIGRPAVPAMIELMKKGGNPATRARTVLGNMGPQAEQALDWLIATALDRKPPAAQDKRRTNAVICLSYMTWAADRLIPVFAEIAEDRQAETGVRRVAISGLQRIGGEAVPILQEIADSEQGEIRDSARRALSERLAKEGVLSRQDYYTQLVEEDPFDPSVPRYLTSTKGIVNYGKPHALTNKVKAMYRQRLQEDPDPELAWRLAAIIQNGLRSTELEWAAPTDSSSSKWNREDPAESFATLADVLELGFSHTEPRSELWLDLGISLAKLRLLQGNWDGMNATLKRLGQEPIPEESRPGLSAPPVDWSVGLRSQWQIADESMRSGNCSLEFRVEKDGKGLKGVHVLVKRAPEPTRVFRTGIATDTLFYAPHPIESYRDSFGYRGNDREETRYAVSDESGVVRFERLPDIPIKIEVLVPTANFAEAGSSWDLWMEVEPGQFKIAKIYGADAVSPRTPPAVVTLKPGQTVRYPKLVVRPAFGLNVQDWDRVDKDSFVLSWQGLGTQPQEIHYELEMSLSAPSQDPDHTEGASLKVESTKQILAENQWPVGSKGVDGMRLEPGNIYMFEVKAVDESGTVVARWPKTRVWVPWGYRQSNPPTIERDLENNSPIYNGVWFRGSFSYGDGREETLPERVSRFLRERPDAFEHEYVRMGKAWLNWHAGDAAGARRELEQLAKELPKGNLARGTAVWLLQQMDDNQDPPKRLNFVPDRETEAPNATSQPDGKTHVRAGYEGSSSKLEFRVAPDTTWAELNPEELERYKKDLAENGPVDSRRRSDKLAWFEIKSGVNVLNALVTEEYQGRNYLLLHNSEPFVMLPEQGWGLQRVEVIKDPRGRPAVGLEFDQEGAELLYELTKANLRKTLAIILNGKVVSAPTIESAIRKRAVITGTFTEQEVQQMVQALQRGLPPVKMGEQTGIDPTDRSAEFARLHEQLKSEDSRQREDAARELGQFRDTRAVDALIAALRDGEVAVRAAAARALGKIGDKRAVEPLIEAYQEQSYESFVDTLWALGDIGGTRAEQMLVAALNYQGYHPYVRNIAAKNLERLGWKPADREQNMRFLIALERWEEGIKAGPAAYLKPAGTNQAEGPVEVSIPIVIPLQAEKQTPAISKYPQIEFSAVDGRLKGTLYIRYTSWPHTKWLMRLELLDGGGGVLGQTEKVHSNTGTIETYPHVERAHIAFEFDPGIGPANASRFRFSIESIWTSRGNPLQFDKELPLALELNAVEQPRTISARWIKFENEGDDVRSTIHLKYLSWPKSKWEIRVTLLGANGKQLSDARAIVENSGTVLGVPNSTEKDLQFWLAQQPVAGEDIRYVVTIQKILESNEMAAQPAFD